MVMIGNSPHIMPLSTTFPDCTYLKLSVHRNLCITALKRLIGVNGSDWSGRLMTDDGWRMTERKWRTGVNEALVMSKNLLHVVLRAFMPHSHLSVKPSVVRFNHRSSASVKIALIENMKDHSHLVRRPSSIVSQDRSGSDFNGRRMTDADRKSW